MSQLFDRRVTVLVDGLEVRDLRVTFRVEKNLSKEPNTLELTITNLSRTTRAQMQKKVAKVIVSAGYAGFQRAIFAGDSRLIEHVKNGPDMVTKIQCGDGERSYMSARVSESFKGGTAVATVLEKVMGAMNIDLGTSVSQLGDIAGQQFVNGYTSHGRASSELERLLVSRGFEWSIQDGRLQLLKPGQTNTDTVTVLDKDSGLIGSPEFASPDKKGSKPVLKARTLLQPQIRPGCRIRVDSLNVKGEFRAEKVYHEGDTAGGSWYTDVEASPVT